MSAASNASRGGSHPIGRYEAVHGEAHATTIPQPARGPARSRPEGNIVEIPDGAVGWRIRRQTGGRPRIQLDARKQPMVFPLDYTLADAEDILPHGSYLLDLIDKNGEPLGITIPLVIQPMRNAAPAQDGRDDDDEAEHGPSTLPGMMSEVRLVLEANVRSTQLAFQHTERTLEMGLRVAETLRDGVQVLASSQADWTKSLASSRGFFRSSPGALPSVEVKQLTLHTGDHGSSGEDGDEDSDEPESDEGPPSPAPSDHWMDQLTPALIALSQQIMPLISAWGNKTRGGSSTADVPAVAPAGGAVPPPPDEDLAASTIDDHVASLRRAVFEAGNPGPGINFLRLLQLLPPSTAAKINAVQARMDPADRGAAIQILQRHDAEGLCDLLLVLERASLDQAADFLRRLTADWRVDVAEQQSARARAAATPTAPTTPTTPDDSPNDAASGAASKPKAPR